MTFIPAIGHIVQAVRVTKMDTLGYMCACVCELNNLNPNKNLFILVYDYDMTFSMTFRDISHLHICTLESYRIVRRFY